MQGKQTNRERESTDRHEGTGRGRQAKRQTGRETADGKREAGGLTDREREKTERQREGEAGRQTDRERKTNR